MSSILNTSLSLSEMEEVIEEKLLDSTQNIRIIGDLGLSQDDFKCLLLKLKGFNKYNNNFSAFITHRLGVVTTCIYSLRYENSTSNAEIINELIINMGQYQVRSFFKICTNTLEEYGLSTYGTEVSSLQGLLELFTVHAGIETKFYNEFFESMNNSLGLKEIRELGDKIINGFSKELRNKYKYLPNIVLKDMITSYRSAFVDCKIKGFTEKNLLEKYSLVSSEIIKECVKWCKNYEAEYENNIYNKKIFIT